jgi:hypothetical protein
MKFSSSILLSLCLLAVFTQATFAQTPKPKRPVKNPPQYPNIIDAENKESAERSQSAEDKSQSPAAIEEKPSTDELLLKALIGLTFEVRGLVQEMRSLNTRQQAQLDMLRLTRADLRIETYDRELKTVRERLATLEAEEQNLVMLLRPENLNNQVNTMPTFDRSTTMKQLQNVHESRLRVVRSEKDNLQKREAELIVMMEGFRNSITEAEKRLQAMEESLKPSDPASAKETDKDKKPEPDKPMPDKPLV